MDNDQVMAANDEAASAETVEAPKKTTRARRKAAPKSGEPSTTAEGIAIEPPASGAVGGAEETPATPEAKVTARRSRARKKAAEETLPGFDEGSAVGGLVDSPSLEQESEAAAPKAVRRRRAVKAATQPEISVEPETTPGSETSGERESIAAPAQAEAAPAEEAIEAEAAPVEGAIEAEAVPAEGAFEAEAVPAEDASEVAVGAEAPESASPDVEESAGEESAMGKTAAAAGASAGVEPASAGKASSASLFLEPVSITSMIFQAPDLSAVVRPAPGEAAEETAEEGEEAGLEEGAGRRRRRSRGRRGRRGTDREVSSDEGGEGTEASAETTSVDEGLEDGVTSRRRRRRRRGDQDLELTGGGDDDPPNTVTRVRAPRTHVESITSNRVASVKGSTRLEAKKQRRRESRESGRRRQVITEAEFLARRESVDRQMVVRQRDDRIQIAVLEDGVLAEHFVSKTQQDSLIGNVYLGKVQNVLPSMEAAFVDIGRGRNAVLYAGEVNWDAVTLEGQPRRIENALKSGDSVLVQVTKDPVGHKGARLTSQISLPGRYLVYVPGGSMTGISRKLPDVERNRLKRILKDRLPDDAGVIVRTAAEGASEEELTHDINRLRAQWEGIQSQANSTKVLAPELLYGEPDLTIKVVRDVFNEDFSKLIVSGDEAWDTIEAYVTYVAPDLVGRLEKWTSEQDIFSAWRIDEQIHKALERKVYLPSGGSLVIDRTEAMTVVDVNTGKFTGSGGNLEETVTKNNLEAAEEVVRQLRLRDIGGIIVIDFIDMVLESNRDLVLRRLVECLGRDRTKHQVAEVTSLGLVQMTRKRMGTGLLEVFGEQCEHCAGRGVVTHDEPIEHRRANAVAAEHHHQRAEALPSTRPERKRRRGRGGQPLEPVAPSAPAPHTAAAVDPAAEAAQRQAKAEATRAALANIAAAAHAAHLHEDELAQAAAAKAAETLKEAGGQAPEAADKESDVEAAATRPAPVLRFGGEEVALPSVRRSEESVRPQPAMSLDVLAEAFAHLGGAEAPADAGGGDSGTGGEHDGSPVQKPESPAGDVEQHDGSGPAGTTSSSRRGRRNRSASRAQGAANATSVEHHEVAAATAGGTSHQAKAPEAAPAKPAATEPIILGVGVPASEL